MVTADAISMHTNIDTNHGLKALRSFLEFYYVEELRSTDNLLPKFDVDMILSRSRKTCYALEYI